MLSGPVKTPFGYYVFEVIGTTARLPADARAGAGVDQAAADGDPAADGAEQVRQGLQKEVEGENRLPLGYVVADCKQYKAPKNSRRPDHHRTLAGPRGAPSGARRSQARPARAAAPSSGRLAHEPDRASPRAPDPRQPRQPHRRGRGRAALGRARARGGALGRLDGRVRGRPSCATAASAGQGKGVTRAVANVNGEIAARRRAASTRPTSRALDGALIELDGTPNKSRLGANAILGVSLAAAHAQAAEERLPLWRYLGGEARARPAGADDERAQRRRARRQQGRLPGVHGRAVRRGELRRVPAHGRRGLPRAQAHAARARPRHGGRRRGRLRAGPRLQRGGARDARRRASRRPATGPARTSRSRSTPRPASSIATAPTCSSTRAARCSAAELADYWADLAARYPIVSIEDGMDEEDWDGWKTLTERLGARVQLVGDDLFVTNTERLRRGIEARRRQLDPDQGQPDRHADRDAGRRSRWRARPGYTAVMSHRSGETEDVTIADLAVATGCGQIKTGAPVALGPRRQVQPAAAHRGAARRRTPSSPAAAAFAVAERALAGARRQEDARRARKRWMPSACRRLDAARSSRRGAPHARRRRLARARARSARAAGSRALGPPRPRRRCCACWSALVYLYLERRRAHALDLAPVAPRQRRGRDDGTRTRAARAPARSPQPPGHARSRGAPAGHDEARASSPTSSAACRRTDVRSRPLLASPACRSRTRSTSGSRASGACARRRPSAARLLERVIDALVAELRRRLGGRFAAEELVELYEQRHALVPAGGDASRARGPVGVGGRRGGRRGLRALPARGRRLRRRPARGRTGRAPSRPRRRGGSRSGPLRR